MASKEKYLLALDQGTTSSRARVIDSRGGVKTVAQKEFAQHFPKPGFVEHDAEEIWSTQFAMAHEAMAKANLTTKDLMAIGITNQRETTVIWDRMTSKPIAPAIVWQDRRTTALCEELKEKGLEPLFTKKTGLLLDPYFSATKIRYLLDHVPGARTRAEKGELAFGTIDSWLVWKLTNGKVHITDATNASRTLLFNIHTLKWDEELLRLFDIPSSLLPEVRSSSEVYCDSILHAPIAGIAGDQQAALFGQACFESGMVKATYGTGCFLLMNTGATPILSKNRLLTTVALQIGKTTHYALEGSVFNAGTAIQWLRDGLGLIRESSEINALASQVATTEGVYFVPAFTGLGAPHWDPYARGTLLGLTRGTKPAHIARATLESIAFQAADVLLSMEQDSGIKLKELRVDGGAVASQLLMQFQSDLMQTPVLRPKTRELTALGAAFLAGLAIGIWSNQEEIASLWQLDCRFSPQVPKQDMSGRIARWKRAIEHAKGWAHE